MTSKILRTLGKTLGKIILYNQGISRVGLQWTKPTGFNDSRYRSLRLTTFEEEVENLGISLKYQGDHLAALHGFLEVSSLLYGNCL